MTRKTGFNVDTPNNRVFGPGQLFFNYDLETLTGTAVGATQGGSEIDLGRTLRTPEIDGLPGPGRGLQNVDKVAPTLKVKLFEISETNLLAAIAGAVKDGDGNIIGGDVTDDNYIDNVTLVCESRGESDYIVVLYNCLVVKPGAFKFEDGKESGLEVTFAAHYDLSKPDEEPWKIVPVVQESGS